MGCNVQEQSSSTIKLYLLVEIYTRINVNIICGRCIFVWKIPHDMAVTMHARLSQQAMRQGKALDDEVYTDSSSYDFYETNVSSVNNNYK